MSKLAKALTAAAGNAGESLYVEDVFSTYLYTGNGSTQTITNGIDLSGEGGLVWIKNRDAADSHYLADTERSTNGTLNPRLESDTTDAQVSNGAMNLDSSFNSDGFSIASYAPVNSNAEKFASWTFRKAEKFFDVVTYTGDNTSNRAISHNLGADVGMLIVKCTSAVTDWQVWHKDLSTNNKILLNSTAAETSSFAAFDFGDGANITPPTSTDFYVGQTSRTNGSGQTYVAYLFASDAGGFGDDGSESIIKCGSYTASSAGTEINLGFEPQWIMIKKTNDTENWYIYDAMRGVVTKGDNSQDKKIVANFAGVEAAVPAPIIAFSANGFILESTDNELNGAGGTYIYIAIRRPMKTPRSGTEVFAMDINSSTNTTPIFTASFTPDFVFAGKDSGTDKWYVSNRLTGFAKLNFSSTSAEVNNVGYSLYFNGAYSNAFNGYSGWLFKRATGFFDVVAYTTPTQVNTTVYHNLGVVPELAIIKRRDSAGNWFVAIPTDGTLILNSTTTKSTTLRFTGATETQFTAGAGGTYSIAETNADWIVYLFATLAGVSKVGSYTGTGSNVDVDCGFSAGARFILIKRTDSTGDWYVWDSERGIVAGDDPYLLLNSTAAEVTNTDYIDPLASGFTVTSSAPAALNASGGTYIFLAIS